MFWSRRKVASGERGGRSRSGKASVLRRKSAASAFHAPSRGLRSPRRISLSALAGSTPPRRCPLWGDSSSMCTLSIAENLCRTEAKGSPVTPDPPSGMKIPSRWTQLTREPQPSLESQRDVAGGKQGPLSAFGKRSEDKRYRRVTALSDCATATARSAGFAAWRAMVR